MQELVPAAELPVVVGLETSTIVIVGLYQGTFQWPITMGEIKVVKCQVYMVRELLQGYFKCHFT